MFSFLKKKGNVNEIPEWASFFTGKEYTFFIIEIKKYLDHLSVSYEILDGIIKVEDAIFGLNQLGLVNVAQVCKQNKMAEYGEIITEHFNALIRSNNFNEEFEKNINDFEKVKPYLGVRLYHHDYFEKVGIKNTIGTYLTETVYCTLVFNLPDSINSVKPEQAENWGQNSEELIKLGIKNIKQNHEWEITEERIGNLKIWFVQSEHFFGPNIVFDLKNRKELLNDMGVLIAMPHRHAVIIYPIKTLEVVDAINSLIPIVDGMNQEGPGSLTNQLYYYKNEIFLNLPYKLSDGKVEFTPPDEFIEVLNNLQ